MNSNKSLQQVAFVTVRFINEGIAESSGAFVGQLERPLMDVSVKGVWLCVKAKIPQMLKPGGNAIVSLSSKGGLIAAP